MFLSKVLLLVLPVIVVGELKGGFNYNRCDAEKGPFNWPDQCKDQTSGTPINLCDPIPFPNCPPKVVLKDYECPRALKIYNDGASIGFDLVTSPLTPVPTLTVDSLSFLVGRSPKPYVQEWKLHNIHVHWGRVGKPDEGSEHFLEGRATAAEVHFVHFNSRYGNFSNAVSLGKPDALLVVGVFLELNKNPLFQTEPAFVKAIANAIPTATKTSKLVPTPVRLSDLVSNDHFYSYGGSLTTPGCFEIVTWIVLKTPRLITLASLNKFWEASASPAAAAEKFDTQSGKLISEFGNYRPLQPLGDRNLFFTGACSSGTCKSVQEPDFKCGI